MIIWFLEVKCEATCFEKHDNIHREFAAKISSGEIITIDYPIITSSISEHKIQNDFNWKYFRIVNTFKTGRNNLSISIPCKIEMTYSPIVKLGV